MTNSPTVQIKETIKEKYRGQVFGNIIIRNYSTNEQIGYIDYTISGKTFYIDMIKIEPKYRRKGYATQLMEYVKKKYKGYEVDSGTFYPDGKKFFAALKNKVR
jgi:GNAT superfamily N-acetyltransferase